MSGAVQVQMRAFDRRDFCFKPRREVADKPGGLAEPLFAEREVIVCAGAVQSPQLLMLSGIGDPDHLKSMAYRLRLKALMLDRICKTIWM